MLSKIRPVKSRLSSLPFNLYGFTLTLFLVLYIRWLKPSDKFQNLDTVY